MPKKPMNRRTFLRAAGVCVGLPLLDAMLPIGLGQEQRAAAMRPRRMLLIGRPLGLHTPFLFPDQAGPNYTHTRYTRILDAHRRQFTVFSGMSHRGYPDGHHTDVGLMTGAPGEGIRLNDVRNTISLDQEADTTGRAASFGSSSCRARPRRSRASCAGCAMGAASSTTSASRHVSSRISLARTIANGSTFS